MPSSSAPGGRSPDITRFLQRLRPDLAASFSAEQLAAVELHFAMRNRPRHAIDWRRRITFGRRRVYIIVLVGRERGGD